MNEKLKAILDLSDSDKAELFAELKATHGRVQLNRKPKPVYGGYSYQREDGTRVFVSVGDTPEQARRQREKQRRKIEREIKGVKAKLEPLMKKATEVESEIERIESLDSSHWERRNGTNLLRTQLEDLYHNLHQNRLEGINQLAARLERLEEKLEACPPIEG